jgi:2-methylaconitate cis-trans-isomerase PrpF
MIGMASSPQEASEKVQAIPKIAFVSRPRDYQAITAKMILKNEIDLVGRIISMGTLHKAYAGTGAICTAGAAKIEGTIVNEMFGGDDQAEIIRIGHPGGIMEIGVKVEKNGNTYEYVEAVVGRTARRLMEGYVCVPQNYF